MPAGRQALRFSLHAMAFDQAGYFTAAQAKESGYSYQAQKYHVDYGNWLRVDRGIFRLPAWPDRPTDHLVRWTLWSRGLGVVSHETALSFHDLSDVNPDRVHLSVPEGFRSHDPAVTTHLAALPSDEIQHHDGFCVTTVERTLLDAAGSSLSQELLEQAVHEAVERGLTSPRRLRRRTASAPDREALGIERALSTLAVAT